MAGPVPPRGLPPAPDPAHERTPADGAATDEPARADHGAGPLPRRLPRPAPDESRPPAPPPSGTGRPLRRRVRGATLRTTAGAAPTTVPQAVPQTVRPLDAEAVRSELEEFEEAVERARRDAGTDTFTRPDDSSDTSDSTSTRPASRKEPES